MTEKQKKCIDWICDILDIKYNGGNNRYDAWRFINDYIDIAKKEYEEKVLYVVF